MTLIQVNPALLNTYGQNASEQFQNMAGTLGSIVNDVSSLQYAGANAFAFKQQCEEIATNYTGFMNNQLTTMGNAIITASQNIERALGGNIINFTIEPVNVSTTIANTQSDTVVVDQAQLEQTKANIAGYFDQMVQQLEAHQSSFNRAAAEWRGNAQTVAADAVGRTTRSAVEETTRVKSEIVKAMQAQRDSADSADNSLQVS